MDKRSMDNVINNTNKHTEYSELRVDSIIESIKKLKQSVDLPYTVPSNLSEEEQELISCYRELDKRGQDDIQMLVEMLAKKGRK